MEREIKFKAKMTTEMAKAINAVDNRWVEGYYYKDLCDGILKSFITDGAHKFEVDENTIGQYSGREDDKGKEIYEGDIIRATYLDEINESGGCFEVIYDGDSFSAKVDTGYILCLYELWDIEVIGNIYDNPELLNRED